VFFGITTLVFATTGHYLVAVIVLVIGGVANMASMSITQSVVQLEAPPGDRAASSASSACSAVACEPRTG
jgi:hypothetical protein